MWLARCPPPVWHHCLTGLGSPRLMPQGELTLAELSLGCSSWLWSEGCSFCETARILWYQPSCDGAFFGNGAVRSHGVLQQPECAAVKKRKKGDDWSMQMF